ncbi:MAG TPA: DHH family phosphoesterase [Solirubrobacteraceae bacterium]|jgi:phosphoesterase RecJ-like protein|nr:DHH family phosphoesterase [Solirubrobacteraceae bacterium]
MSENGNGAHTGGRAADTRELVLARLREDERFLLATHENVDGDAIGSLVAMQGLLTTLGKDALVYVAPGDLPLPDEYRFFALEGGAAGRQAGWPKRGCEPQASVPRLRPGPSFLMKRLVETAPADIARRTVVLLDCGNIDRNCAPMLREGAHLLNIDHHHDNTRFGTLAHVVPEACSTAEIIWDLMHGLGVAPTPVVAQALYVGLITDTGRFMYENTGPRAHRMAAELIEAGVDVQDVYRRLYEEMPFAKLALLARALGRVCSYDYGELTLASLDAADFAEVGAEESHSEGVVDHLRAVRGTKVAALVRELTAPERRGERKVSLRATDDDVDVSAIARARGGGGHRRAAGFSTSESLEELIEFLRAEVAAQLHPVPAPA